jgi:GcrA cell cycle regulator
MSKSWDSSILKKLKALVGKGLSTAEIGKRLGMSKNAIVGKLHRLGWNPKATDGASESKKSKKVPKKKSAAKKAPVKPVKKTTVKETKKTVKTAKTPKTAKNIKPATPTTKPVAKTGGGHAIAAKNSGAHQRAVRHALEMANLKPNQCRWPIGDPDSEGFHFCGATVFVGKPYCYEHCKQAYQFVAPKKK